VVESEQAKCASCRLLGKRPKEVEPEVAARLAAAADWAVLACSVCHQPAKRAVTLSCCGPTAAACRVCAVKSLTAERACWECQAEAR
jgi:hypothetical protein